MEEHLIDFDKIKWGSFTKDLKKFNKKNNTNYNISEFAHLIVNNPEHFKPLQKKELIFILIF